MKSYRKKPVVIQAIEFRYRLFAESEQGPRGTGNFSDVTDFLGKDYENIIGYDDGPHILIRTLEGTMHASPGDYIIRGVQGEHYPCKPDIFHATYEEAT